MTARRPRNVSALTQPFWDAAARHQLVRPVCSECGTNFFTPQLACPACHSLRWSYEASSGHGRIYSFSVVYRAPTPGFDPPYVVADVDLDEGWHMMSNISTPAPHSVRIGDRVTVGFVDVEPGVVLPVFIRDDEEPA